MVGPGENLTNDNNVFSFVCNPYYSGKTSFVEKACPTRRAGEPASPFSNDAAHDAIKIIETRYSLEKTLEQFQPILVSTNTDPTIMNLVSALYQTNALILQQNEVVSFGEGPLFTHFPVETLAECFWKSFSMTMHLSPRVGKIVAKSEQKSDHSLPGLSTLHRGQKEQCGS